MHVSFSVSIDMVCPWERNGGICIDTSQYENVFNPGVLKLLKPWAVGGAKKWGKRPWAV